MRFVTVSLVSAFFLVAVVIPPTDATQVMYQSPQQMGTRSDLVIRGRVESSESYWNDKHTKIYTRTRISVDQAYKGAAPAAIDIIQIGGTVGSFRVTVHGAATWHPGEEVLLFAEQNAAGSYRVSGFSQGKFRIERDPETGEPFIRAPRNEGIQILGTPVAATGRAALGGVPLDEFLRNALGQSAIPGASK